MAALNTIVAPETERKAVDHIYREAVQLLPSLAQQLKQGQEQRHIGMPAPVDAIFAQRVRDVTFVLKHLARLFQQTIASVSQGSNIG